jgi:hypothetical protein
MKKILPIFFVLALLIVAGFGVFIYKEEQERNKIKWKVEIIHEYVNVRDASNTNSTIIGKAVQGNVYPVLSVNLDHPSYVWYEIEYRKGQSGWIASERNFPYVKEYNNPNFKPDEDNNSVEDTYEIDYVNPVVKYYESIYYTHDINSITYDHLEIEEESKYEITDKIYVEQCKTYRNFWIQYVVTDSFGNTTKKVQKIVFEVEPDIKGMPSLGEIRNNLCQSP